MKMGEITGVDNNLLFYAYNIHLETSYILNYFAKDLFSGIYKIYTMALLLYLLVFR